MDDKMATWILELLKKAYNESHQHNSDKKYTAEEMSDLESAAYLRGFEEGQKEAARIIGRQFTDSEQYQKGYMAGHSDGYRDGATSDEEYRFGPGD